MRWLHGLLIITGLAGATEAVKLQPAMNYPQVSLGVLRRVMVDYYLLTRANQLEFNVGAIPDTGVWLRVYTRLWWRGSDEEKKYVIGFKDDHSTRRFELQTTVSSSTVGPAGQRVGRWRSFFVRLQPGTKRVILVLDSADSDTVGVRLSLQSPRVWERIKIPGSEVTVIETRDSNEVRMDGYHIYQTGEPFSFVLTGPAQIRIRMRLNFVAGMNREETFLLRVEDGDRVVSEQPLRVRRDINARYAELGDVLPSVERRIRFGIGNGTHRLKVLVSGTMAKGGVLIVEKARRERYE